MHIGGVGNRQVAEVVCLGKNKMDCFQNNLCIGCELMNHCISSVNLGAPAALEVGLGLFISILHLDFEMVLLLVIFGDLHFLSKEKNSIPHILATVGWLFCTTGMLFPVMSLDSVYLLMFPNLHCVCYMDSQWCI